MKYEIMVGILFDLLSKRTVTARYLSDKYGVSIRSIYRYINSLELAGVPLYTVRGNNGGFCIVDTYKLPATFMTPTEYEQTISALNAVNSNTANKVLESAITKLKSNIKNEYSGFNVKGALVIDAGPWGDTVGYKSKLQVIQKSIDDCMQIEISYHDRNGEKTQRIIEPYLILFKQGLWYTYAYCTLRKDFRLFKIGRIEMAKVTKNPFVKKEIDYDDLPLDFWHENVLAEQVSFEINKSILSDIEEWLGVENVFEKDGKYFSEVSLPFDNGLISKIMSYGSELKVLAPEKLKNAIKDSCNKILNNYD